MYGNLNCNMLELNSNGLHLLLQDSLSKDYFRLVRFLYVTCCKCTPACAYFNVSVSAYA